MGVTDRQLGLGLGLEHATGRFDAEAAHVGGLDGPADLLAALVGQAAADGLWLVEGGVEDQTALWLGANVPGHAGGHGGRSVGCGLAVGGAAVWTRPVGSWLVDRMTTR